jgi:hypothetical protein
VFEIGVGLGWRSYLNTVNERGFGILIVSIF